MMTQVGGDGMQDPINLALNKNEAESHGLRGPMVENQTNGRNH
jgi:hypothetical protein